MREAMVKCFGTGLASAPVAGGADSIAPLWTAELEIGPHAVAALAVADEKPALEEPASGLAILKRQLLGEVA
jgi:hypothetical protein